jgi:hypothetical protein
MRTDGRTGRRAGRQGVWQTDRHDEANIRLSQFANAPKKRKFTLEKAMRAQRESRRRGVGADCQRHPRSLYHTREGDPARIVHKAGWVAGPVWTGSENQALTGT